MPIGAVVHEAMHGRTDHVDSNHLAFIVQPNAMVDVIPVAGKSSIMARVPKLSRNPCVTALLST